MPIVPPSTTLSAAMTRTQRLVSLASGTGIAVGMFLIIGSEIVLVQTLVKSDGSIIEVERGQNGTSAKPHVSGLPVYLSSTANPPAYTFASKNGRATVKNDITNALPDFPMPLGSTVVDPDTGYEYVVVDVSEAMVVGEWVVISADGAASPLNAASIGRVGIITQTIGASDTLALALVAGKYAGALISSLSSLAPPAWIAAAGAVSGVVQTVPSGTSALATVSDTGPGENLVFGAIFVAETTSAVSSGSSLGLVTVILNNPYVQGLPLFSS